VLLMLMLLPLDLLREEEPSTREPSAVEAESQPQQWDDGPWGR
jgi:hypothetical protein